MLLIGAELFTHNIERALCMCHYHRSTNNSPSSNWLVRCFHIFFCCQKCNFGSDDLPFTLYYISLSNTAYLCSSLHIINRIAFFSLPFSSLFTSDCQFSLEVNYFFSSLLSHCKCEVHKYTPILHWEMLLLLFCCCGARWHDVRWNCQSQWRIVCVWRLHLRLTVDCERFWDEV